MVIFDYSNLNMRLMRLISHSRKLITWSFSWRR